jgi:hypothetical protein
MTGKLSAIFQYLGASNVDRYKLDIANEAVRPLEGDSPSSKGAKRADKEEPEEATVHLAG